MAATPLDSLAQYIAVDLAIGALGTVVFEDSMPDQPDTCIAIYNSGGAAPALTSGDDTDYPSFQLRSRAADADVARTNLITIYQALHAVTETDIHGTHFKVIGYKQSNPVPLGKDEKQRFEFTQNLFAFVRGVTR
jgi:hypothetical protein